jgi:citrate lyase beta subunit
MTCALYPERYGRAAEHGADIGTVDLEDSVPPARKAEARQHAVRYLASAPPGLPATAVRVNGLRNEEGLLDITALLAGGARPDILFLPKVEGPEEVALVGQLIGARLPGTVILATIETARGLAAVERIASGAGPQLWGFIFGAYDYSADVGCTMSWEDLLYARGRLVAAGTQAGLPVIDAPCFDLDDSRGLAEQVARGRRMGFAGMAAVHPSQVAAINAGYTPGTTTEDPTWNRPSIVSATTPPPSGSAIPPGTRPGSKG